MLTSNIRHSYGHLLPLAPPITIPMRDNTLWTSLNPGICQYTKLTTIPAAVRGATIAIITGKLNILSRNFFFSSFSYNLKGLKPQEIAMKIFFLDFLYWRRWYMLLLLQIWVSCSRWTFSTHDVI